MEEIGLQELIFQVKQELLAPNPAQRAKDPYPLFFIDKVDLEVAVKVSKSKGGGIKLTVLDFAEANASGSVVRERGHVVKVSLSPLLSREEIVAEALKDPHVREMVEKRSSQAVVKGVDPLGGEPE
jgi:hypothetical protein